MILLISCKKEKHIHFFHLDDIQKISLDFSTIDDDFWELYFESDIFDNFYSSDIVKVLGISLADIEKIVDRYLIKDNLEKYITFRLDKEIDEFLMKDKDFQLHMENLWDKHKQQEKEHAQEIEEMRKESDNYLLEQEQKEKQNKLYKKKVSELSTKTDLYNIFNYLINNNHSLYDDLAELDQILKDELGDKHPLLVGLIKKEWNEDVEEGLT